MITTVDRRSWHPDLTEAQVDRLMELAYEYAEAYAKEHDCVMEIGLGATLDEFGRIDWDITHDGVSDAEIEKLLVKIMQGVFPYKIMTRSDEDHQDFSNLGPQTA